MHLPPRNPTVVRKENPRRAMRGRLDLTPVSHQSSVVSRQSSVISCTPSGIPNTPSGTSKGRGHQSEVEPEVVPQTEEVSLPHIFELDHPTTIVEQPTELLESTTPSDEVSVDDSPLIATEEVVDNLILENNEMKEANTMSDSTVITPGSGQAVITTGDSDNSRFWENTILREVNANFRELFESVTTNATADAAAFKDAQATAYLVEGRINVQAALNAAAIQVQAEKLAAASVLQASQNTATVQAAIAKCCCETQEQIIASSQAVLNRMNEIEIARQATLLSDEKQKVLVLQSQVIALGATPAASARIA